MDRVCDPTKRSSETVNLRPRSKHIAPNSTSMKIKSCVITTHGPTPKKGLIVTPGIHSKK